MFASHHWPRWGNARIQEVLRGQRDLYANMNNQVLPLTNIEGFQAKSPTLTLKIKRCDLEQTMMGTKTLEAQIADGTAKAEGDTSVLKQLASTMVDFDPRFEILPGTKARGAAIEKTDPFQATPRETIAE